MSGSLRRIFTSHPVTTKSLITVTVSLIVIASICTLLTFPRGLAAPIVSDDFNDNSLDTSKWDTNLFSGFTNTNVPIAETSQRLEIGPLLQNTSGSSYRGIRTLSSYSFSDAYAYVELVQAAASNTAADAMFTVGESVTAYYRIFVEAGTLIGQRNIGGTKTTLFSISYNTTNHRFLRIRHTSSGTVTLDTAPGSGGVPGTWTQQYSEIWSSSIPRTATIFEVKGGTWQAEANAPGTVIFDNFVVASNSAPTVTAISPSSGTTSGGTSVTITGTNFLTGATVTFGGTAATNVTVVSSTSITATTPAHAAGAVDVVVTNTDSQAATLTNGFTYTSAETAILSDDFNDNSLDTNKWVSTNLFSGFTNTNVPIAETNQRIEIGPLLQNVSGSSYRGIRTVNSYDFTGAYTYVELVQAAASNTAGDAMFTVGNSVTAYYRLFVEAGTLFGQRNVGGTKTTLFSITYDSTNHRFLRIRHDASTNSVTLDTAPGSAGSPGTWVQRYTETWHSSISTTGILFEVKGGTWQVEANPPGTVIFDNFHAATPGSGSGSENEISNIKVVVTCNTSVLINFRTSSPSHAYISYGPTTSYGTDTIDDTSRHYTEHAIPLTGLVANTTYNFRVNATDSSLTQSTNQTFTTTSSGAACPALPVQVDSRMPDMTGASEKTVKASGGHYTSLQSAINDAASAGEKRFITVDAGMSFNNIRLPAKSGTNWVIIRSANHSSLAEGRRVSPTAASNMFKITTTVAGGGDEPLATTGVSSYWRIIGAEVTIEDSALGDVDVNQMGLVQVGPDTATAANMPHHIVFDRMYVHGLPNRSTARGFYLRAGEDLAIIDSYVSEFHSTGVDSQAILAMANKRVKILNNYVEGSGENFMWGGDGLCCPGYEPSDLTYVHNYQRWLLAWKMDHADFGTFAITGVDTTANTLTSNNHKLPAGKLMRFTSTGSLPSPLASATTIANYWVCNPTTNTFQVSTTSNCSAIVDLTSGGSGTIRGGIDYVKKNLFELKTSSKTLVFGNLFENMWGPDQDTAINIKLERNSCRTFTVNTSTDVVTGSGSPPALNGQQVRLQNSGGALPAPLSDSTTYFARDISGSTFKLAATPGGAAIDISTTGSGTHRYEYALEMLQDLTFFRNHVRNAPLAVVIQSSLNGNGCPVGWRPGSFYGSRISFLHNLFEIDAQIWTNDHDGSGYGQAGRALYITGMTHGSSAQGPDAYTFDHNTFINAHPPTNPDDSDFGTGGMMMILDPNVSSGTKGANFVFTNNIVGHREYGVRGDWATGTTVLNDFFTGYTWNKNMVVKNTQTHPESSLYVTNWTNAKFVNFNNGRGGNYRLAADSPGKNAGTDELDVGADIDGLLGATTNTLTGNWSAP